VAHLPKQGTWETMAVATPTDFWQAGDDVGRGGGLELDRHAMKPFGGSGEGRGSLERVSP
jgi:hypothetical protein